MNIDEIRLVEEKMRKIIPIFLSELIEYVPYEKRRYLKDEFNLRNVIDFANGFGIWSYGNNIFLAIQNGATFKRLSKNPKFGQKKGSILVTEEESIENDKDYVDYMEYFIDNGLTELDYYLDFLPHTIMHLVGSSDGVLGEGITELRTRQICKKYNIRCAPIMHSKETKLIIKLEKIFGEICLNEASFLHNFSVLEEKCEKKFGKEKFREVYEELRVNYRDYVMDRVLDPIEHYKNYRKIDFGKIYELVDNYEKQQESIDETDEKGIENCVII